MITEICRALGKEAGCFKLEYESSVTSTNTLLKERAEEAGDGTVLIAGHQCAGRGRSGKSFFSPEGTGVYLSVLLKEKEQIRDPGRLTTAAAIAACRAIEDTAGVEAKIKWVNDIYVSGKKVCGILTEASLIPGSGIVAWAVVGVGFNVYAPENGFPEDLRETAGAVAGRRRGEEDLRPALAGAFLRELHGLLSYLQAPALYDEYRTRCFLLGQPVFVLRGEEKIPATVVDLAPDFSLLVRYDSGSQERLCSGEISIRPASSFFGQV